MAGGHPGEGEEAKKPFFTRGTLWAIMFIVSSLVFLGFNFFYAQSAGEGITLKNLFLPTYMTDAFSDATSAVKSVPGIVKEEEAKRQAVQPRTAADTQEDDGWIGNIGMVLGLLLLVIFGFRRFRKKKRAGEVAGRPPGRLPDATTTPENTNDPATPEGEVQPGLDPDDRTQPRQAAEELPKKPEIPDDAQRFEDLSFKFAGIRSQDGLGACTAFAATSIFEYILYVSQETAGDSKIVKGELLSPLYLWYKTREKLGRVKENAGPSTCAIPMENLLEDGVCREKLWTFEDGSTGKWKVDPTDPAPTDAHSRKILKFNSLDKNDPDQWAHEILGKNPVNIAVHFPTDMRKPYGEKLYTNFNPTSFGGGHAMVIVGYHSHYPHKGRGIKAFKIRNSHSVRWGERGYTWIPAETLKKILWEAPIVIKGWQKKEEEDQEQKQEDPRKKIRDVLLKIQNKKEIAQQKISKLEQQVETIPLEGGIIRKKIEEVGWEKFRDDIIPNLRFDGSKEFKELENELKQLSELHSLHVRLELYYLWLLALENYILQHSEQYRQYFMLLGLEQKVLVHILRLWGELGEIVVATITLIGKHHDIDVQEERIMEKLKGLLDRKQIEERVQERWISAEFKTDAEFKELLLEEIKSYGEAEKSIRAQIEKLKEIVAFLDSLPAEKETTKEQETTDDSEPGAEDNESKAKSANPREIEEQILFKALTEHFNGTHFKLFYPGAYEGSDHAYRLSHADKMICVDPEFSHEVARELKTEQKLASDVSGEDIQIEGVPIELHGRASITFRIDGNKKEIVCIAEDATKDVGEIKTYEVLHYPHAPTNVQVDDIAEENLMKFEHVYALLNKLKLNGVAIHVPIPLCLHAYFENLTFFPSAHPNGASMPEGVSIKIDKLPDVAGLVEYLQKLESETIVARTNYLFRKSTLAAGLEEYAKNLAALKKLFVAISKKKQALALELTQRALRIPITGEYVFPPEASDADREKFIRDGDALFRQIFEVADDEGVIPLIIDYQAADNPITIEQQVGHLRVSVPEKYKGKVGRDKPYLVQWEIRKKVASGAIPSISLGTGVSKDIKKTFAELSSAEHKLVDWLRGKATDLEFYVELIVAKTEGLPDTQAKKVVGRGIREINVRPKEEKKSAGKMAAEAVKRRDLDPEILRALKVMRAACMHPASQKLPDNPVALQAAKGEITAQEAGAKYAEKLSAYDSSTGSFPEKTDYQGNQEKAYWKFHLDVVPNQVQAVSAYLKSNNYRHKYLSGGEPEDGKIFTIYIGSRNKAEEEAAILSEALVGKLAKPVDPKEMELAPGVVGRFAAHTLQGWHQYGLCGMSILDEDMRKFHTFRQEAGLKGKMDYNKLSEEQKKVYDNIRFFSEYRAYQGLHKLFGDYFIGTGQKVELPKKPGKAPNLNPTDGPDQFPLQIKEISTAGKDFRVIGHSARGAEHRRIDSHNQDALLATAGKAGNGPPIILAVADGVGSRDMSQEGSRLAVEVANEVLGKLIGKTYESARQARAALPDEIANLWKNKVEEHILSNDGTDRDKEAIKKTDDDEHENAFESYSTNLACCLVEEHFSMYLQVGDGGIIVGQSKGVQKVFEEPTETKNTLITHTVRHPRDYQTSIVPAAECPDFILIACDGLLDNYKEADLIKVCTESFGIIQNQGIDRFDLKGTVEYNATNAKQDDCTVGIIARVGGRAQIAEANTQLQVRSKTVLIDYDGKGKRPTKAPFAMCFTKKAIEDLIDSVGSKNPETGAIGFGPQEEIGFSVIEYDKGGSEKASSIAYATDVEWATDRLLSYLDGEPLRLWTGVIHSHPGGADAGGPSLVEGPAAGDLGVVQEIFSYHYPMQWFLLPIITFEADEKVTLHPWICKRSSGDKPILMMAPNVIICDEKKFPKREFNPKWKDMLPASYSAPDGIPQWPSTKEHFWPKNRERVAAPADIIKEVINKGAFILNGAMSGKEKPFVEMEIERSSKTGGFQYFDAVQSSVGPKHLAGLFGQLANRSAKLLTDAVAEGVIVSVIHGQKGSVRADSICSNYSGADDLFGLYWKFKRESVSFQNRPSEFSMCVFLPDSLVSHLLDEIVKDPNVLLDLYFKVYPHWGTLEYKNNKDALVTMKPLRNGKLRLIKVSRIGQIDEKVLDYQPRESTAGKSEKKPQPMQGQAKSPDEPMHARVTTKKHISGEEAVIKLQNEGPWNTTDQILNFARSQVKPQKYQGGNYRGKPLYSCVPSGVRNAIHILQFSKLEEDSLIDKISKDYFDSPYIVSAAIHDMILDIARAYGLQFSYTSLLDMVSQLQNGTGVVLWVKVDEKHTYCYYGLKQKKRGDEIMLQVYNPMGKGTFSEKSLRILISESENIGGANLNLMMITKIPLGGHTA